MSVQLLRKFLDLEILAEELVPILEKSGLATRRPAIRFGDFSLSSLMPLVEVPERQILPAAQTPMVGILENPCSRTALDGIELVRFVKDFKKDN